MRYRRIRPGVGDPAGETREVGVRGGIVSQRLQRHEPALEIPENEVSGGASRTRGADNAAGGKKVDARREERLRAYPPGGLDGVVEGVAAARKSVVKGQGEEGRVVRGGRRYSKKQKKTKETG